MHCSATWKPIRRSSLLLFCFFVFQCRGTAKDNFSPKTTTLYLHEPGSNLALRYNQMLIQVDWCLFPSVPVNKTSFYVKVSFMTDSKKTEYFKVENHTKCDYEWTRSPQGLDESRKKYISIASLKNITTRYFQSPCHKGPRIYQHWLGLNYTVPWVSITRCPGRCNPTKTTIAIQRERIYNGGVERINVTKDIACLHRHG